MVVENEVELKGINSHCNINSLCLTILLLERHHQSYNYYGYILCHIGRRLLMSITCVALALIRIYSKIRPETKGGGKGDDDDGDRMVPRTRNMSMRMRMRMRNENENEKMIRIVCEISSELI